MRCANASKMISKLHTSDTFEVVPVPQYQSNLHEGLNNIPLPRLVSLKCFGYMERQFPYF